MPKVDVYDIKGKKVSDVELADSVFGIEPNEAVVHSVLVNYLANQRQGTQSTKTRAEVRGGGKKPWRQKGTGRARQGSIRAPQWIKGGIALGPKPRSYKYTVNNAPTYTKNVNASTRRFEIANEKNNGIKKIKPTPTKISIVQSLLFLGKNSMEIARFLHTTGTLFSLNFSSICASSC